MVADPFLLTGACGMEKSMGLFSCLSQNTGIICWTVTQWLTHIPWFTKHSSRAGASRQVTRRPSFCAMNHFRCRCRRCLVSHKGKALSFNNKPRHPCCPSDNQVLLKKEIAALCTTLIKSLKEGSSTLWLHACANPTQVSLDSSVEGRGV